MSTPKVTILVPNYRTLELTTLCLRLLRKHTDRKLAEVIVIDNDSQDASTDYLRSLQWVTLIERPSIPGEAGFVAHAKALDMALQQVNTPYVLSIHTDTLIKRSDWLTYLLSHIESYPNRAGVGSWKLEKMPWYKRLTRPTGRRSPGHHEFLYLRSHCALYRMSVIRSLGVKFFEQEATPGKYMHLAMEKAGYEMHFLDEAELIDYIAHINHATMVLNPEMLDRRSAAVRGRRRLQRQLKALDAEKMLQEVQWDQ